MIITNIEKFKNEADIYFTDPKELIGVNPTIGLIDEKLLSEEELKMVVDRINSRLGKLFKI